MSHAPPRTFWPAAVAEPDRLAVVDPDGGTHTAGELLARANRIVHHLRAHGVGPGDVVAMLLPNGVELLSVLLAAHQAGWYVTPINTSLTVEEIAYILADSKARAFFAHERYAERASAAAVRAHRDVRGCFGVGAVPGFTPIEEIDAASHALPAERVAGQILQYTSGTTGQPKGVQRPPVMLDPESFYARVAGHLTRFGIQPGGDHVHLVASPMYHTAPLVYGLCSLHFDHPLVLMDRWDGARFLELVARHRVTITHLVPTQLKRLLLLPEAERLAHDVSSLSHLLHAAAPCPIPIKRQMIEWLGPCVYEYYGSTEGGGALVTAEEWLERPGTVGRAWPGAELRILDDDGRELPAGEPGLVYMKLTGDFTYRGDADKTRRGRRGGYFTVGDIGYLDDAGYLYLCDRKIDMIITGGVNVYPAEVEATLLAHPEVRDVAVFGIPDDDRGERVHAVVEPASGAPADADLVERLLAYCAEHLAPYKRPRSMELTRALPRDDNGKLYKRKLRAPYWAGRGRGI